MEKHKQAPMWLSFGWQRAELLGAFFNGVFLAALGVSVLLQTIDRFLNPVKLLNAELVLIVGAIGVFLNVLSLLVLGHDYDDKNVEKQPSTGLGIIGVSVHLMGDTINNIAVILSAAVFITTSFIYADPIASAFVGCMIFSTSVPLVIKSGRLLLESAPLQIDFDAVRQDIIGVDGIESVHELHIWHLTETKTLATVHVVTSNDSLESFVASAQHISERLHRLGIHSLTIQPEPSRLGKNGQVSYKYWPKAKSGANVCRLRCSRGKCSQDACCDW